MAPVPAITSSPAAIFSRAARAFGSPPRYLWDVHGDRVGMHRVGECCRTIVSRQLEHHVAERIVGRAAAAEPDRHAGREESGRLQVGVVLGHEVPSHVAGDRAQPEVGTELSNRLHQLPGLRWVASDGAVINVLVMGLALLRRLCTEYRNESGRAQRGTERCCSRPASTRTPRPAEQHDLVEREVEWFRKQSSEQSSR